MTDRSRDDREGSARHGLLVALPLAVAVGLFGVSFGVLAEAAGLGGLAALVMSAITFAGSAQFAAVSVLTAGGSSAAAIVAAILLNLRYAPIGASVAPYLRGGPLRRLLIGQLVVDESWAISTRAGRTQPRTLLAAGLLIYVAWVAGTLVGIVGGEQLGDPAALGLDAAFPALFLALLAPQLRGRSAVAAALTGAGIALVLLPLTPPGIPIVVAAGAALIGLRRPSHVSPPAEEGLP